MKTDSRRRKRWRPASGLRRGCSRVISRLLKRRFSFVVCGDCNGWLLLWFGRVCPAEGAALIGAPRIARYVHCRMESVVGRNPIAPNALRRMHCPGTSPVAEFIVWLTMGALPVTFPPWKDKHMRRNGIAPYELPRVRAEDSRLR